MQRVVAGRTAASGVLLSARAAAGAQQEFRAAGVDAAYWRQGNEELHTKNVWMARMALRRDSRVVEELQRWWDVALTTIRGEPGSEWACAPEKAPYLRLQKKLYWQLVGAADGSEKDAASCAADDWESDRRGHESVGRELFMDSLFEMADLWTETVDGGQYAAFLAKLLSKVTEVT